METTIMGYIGVIVEFTIGFYGGMSKFWSLSGYPKYKVPYYDRDPKWHHNL